MRTRTNPTAGYQLALALVDTAIENSVRRAQRQLGADQTLLLRGDIGLFDFETALGEGLGDRYDLTVREARDFFIGVEGRTAAAAAARARWRAAASAAVARAAVARLAVTAASATRWPMTCARP